MTKQTDGLPELPEWTKRDDLGGLVPSEIRQAMIAYATQAAEASAVPEGWMVLPDDLWSHRHDWENACKIALASALTEDDRFYWLHQIGTLAKIEVLVAGPPPPMKGNGE